MTATTAITAYAPGQAVLVQHRLPSHLGPPITFTAERKRISLAITGEGVLLGPGHLRLGRFPGPACAAAWCERTGWPHQIGMAGLVGCG